MLALLFTLAAELSRLAGQDVAVSGDGYVIRDVAGEGPPLVGVVERRGEELWLVGDETVRLAGPLATPRIAGPGCKVWVLGDRDASGALQARRIGVLQPRLFGAP